jgi:pilus assembly protein CpaC
LPKLQSAQTAGYARILKTGTVIVRSGQPATLKEETQVGYLLVGQNGQVTSDSVGVGLNVGVTPQILGQSEDISLDLNMTQSNVVARAPANQGKPITAVHNVVTKLYVKSNESAAVAGVTSSTVSTNFNKDDPRTAAADPTSNTSALFSLLHSKSYDKAKGQFVIFVTPQIVENASEGTEDLKRNFRVKVK